VIIHTKNWRRPFELSNDISTLLRSLLTEETSDVDRSLLISDLEQAIQSFLTQTVNVEFDTRDDGNKKELTITTTGPQTGIGSQKNNQWMKIMVMIMVMIMGVGMTNHLRNQNHLKISQLCQ
jgi:hypothetical protein